MIDFTRRHRDGICTGPQLARPARRHLFQELYFPISEQASAILSGLEERQLCQTIVGSRLNYWYNLLLSEIDLDRGLQLFGSWK